MNSISLSKKREGSIHALQSVDAETINGRRIYVSSTEPVSWSDGDIWLQQQ